MVEQRCCDGRMIGVFNRLSIANGLGFVEGRRMRGEVIQKKFIWSKIMRLI